jgi:hypothetical protein
MNKKHYLGILTALFAGILTISVSYAAPAPKYTPAGIWQYSAPEAPEGYNQGQMVVTETEDGIGVTIVFNEYARIEAQKVEFRKKSISFVLIVEYQEFTISGKFSRDSFTGTVDSSMGLYDFSATRGQR